MNKLLTVIAGVVGTYLFILGLFFAFIFTAISINEGEVANLPIAGSIAAVALGIFITKYVAKAKNESFFDVIVDYLIFHWF